MAPRVNNGPRWMVAIGNKSLS